MGGAVMPHPHMLHWDAAHPGGQMVPLRQPTLPVYYNTGPGQHMPGSGGGRWCPALHPTLCQAPGQGRAPGWSPRPARRAAARRQRAAAPCWSQIYYETFIYLQMFSLHMPSQMTLLCSLIVTLVTSILDTFMYRLNMSCQTTLMRKLLITLITSILHTFMFRLGVVP